MATSYSNYGGTGDRRSFITVSIAGITLGGSSPVASQLIDGTTALTLYFASNGAAAGCTILFTMPAYGAAAVIDEAKWYQNVASAHGTWKWQGSNDNTAWTDIGSSFTLGGATPVQTQTTLNGNTTGYRYYRMLGLSGVTSDGTNVQEIEFKISGLSAPAPAGASLAIPITRILKSSSSNPVPVASALKGGIVGEAYSETISAQGGTSPYSFAVTGGALPAGTSLNSSTGVISGTPTTSGTASFTITVTDASGYIGSTAFTIGILAAALTQRGNIDYDQIRGSVRQGSGGKFQMFAGGTAPIAGNLAVYDATGNVADGGNQTNLPLRTSSISTTLTDADYTLIATAPSITITLPSSSVAGKLYNIKNGNTTTGQTVTVSASVNIDVSTSVTLGATASLSVQYDGSQWRIL